METTAITRIQGRAAQTALAAIVAAVIALLAVVHIASAHAAGTSDLHPDDTAAGPQSSAVGGALAETVGAVQTANTGGNDVAIEEIVIAHKGFERAAGPVRQQGRVLLDLDPNPASPPTMSSFRTVEGLTSEMDVVE